ncbi:MAG: response regulator transcription factor [Acidimicrobiales bacterium]
MPDVPPLRVVVADNDPGALELVVTDLRLEGHVIVGACTDGAAALALCVRERPDVVVLDHRMPPGPHGLEVAQRLQVDAPEIRVVVFTNYQDRALVEQVEAAGAVYLPKGSLRALRRAVVGAGLRPR